MATRKLTGPEKKRIAAANQWCCYLCHQLLPSTYEVDHVVPLFEGGADDASNCRPACPSCHRIKSEEECIRRHTQRARPFLLCNVCGLKLSPYFTHKCPNPIKM